MPNISKQVIIYFGQTLDCATKLIYMIEDHLPEIRHNLCFYDNKLGFFYSIIAFSLYFGSKSLKWKKKKDEEDLEKLQRNINLQSVMDFFSEFET